MRDSLSLTWVFVAALVPITFALLLARPLWHRRVRDEGGTIAGAAVVFACSVALIGREFSHVLKVSAACVAREVACHFEPEPFTRYAIYAGIGMLQVFALFMIGLSVEERLRRGAP